jgi:superfamily II DNA or RNA helicase
MPNYEAFLRAKLPASLTQGLANPGSPPENFFPLQKYAVDYALRLGQAGIFLDTGLGKTAIELEFSHQAAKATGQPSLILCPLAVAPQIMLEAKKFGYEEIQVIKERHQVGPGINICNYDRLHKLEPDVFGSISLDESSILKASEGATSNSLREAFSATPFRLCASATPAPNDYTEIGLQAEFLGICSLKVMLAQYFVRDTSRGNKWRLKGHAQEAFWNWFASWAIVATNPADLGFPGEAFVLPELQFHEQVIGTTYRPNKQGFFGQLSATNQHEAKRHTSSARAQAAADIVYSLSGSVVVWCDTDYEADELVRCIPDAVEVRGSLSPQEKEVRLNLFSQGKERIIITKPSIAGWGLNWQHCHQVLFVGRNFSYETWYQAIRRCWRFGQKNPVSVYLIVAAGEQYIGQIVREKENAHNKLKEMMIAASQRRHRDKETCTSTISTKLPNRIPVWLKSHN